MLEEHGAVDYLVNNAGRSIRRSLELTQDRFHDFERTMAINYFGPVRLTMGLLPAMREQGFGHVVNVLSWGVQMKAPKFSAYLASKTALDTPDRGQGDLRRRGHLHQHPVPAGAHRDVRADRGVRRPGPRPPSRPPPGCCVRSRSDRSR